MSRLFKRATPETAKAEIENLLASKHASEIWPAEISAIATKYHLGPSQIHDITLSLWRKSVAAFVADNVLTESEVAYMAALRRTLQICEDDAIQIEREVIHPRFERKVSDVLADGTVSNEEREHLDALGTALRMSATELLALYGPPAGEVVQGKFTDMLSDHRVTPDELASVGRIAEELRVKPSMGPEVESLVRRYAEFWKYENGGQLPRITVSINLQRGEFCHFASAGKWYEPRTKTVTTDFGSVGYSFRIARGVYYRSPRIRATRVRQDVLTLLDEGTVYITNKRVVFDGSARNHSVKIASLLGFEVWSDAIKLEKPTGRSPVIGIDGDVEQAAVILGVVAANQ